MDKYYNKKDTFDSENNVNNLIYNILDLDNSKL